MLEDPDSSGSNPDLRTIATGFLAASPSSKRFRIYAARSSAAAFRVSLNNTRIGRAALTAGLCKP
jgi:hypothetical protein